MSFNKSLLDRYVERYNAGDLDTVMDLYAEDGTQISPTGERVEIEGMELVVVRDGKIIIDNLYYDSAAILAQFGLLPQGGT